MSDCDTDGIIEKVGKIVELAANTCSHASRARALYDEALAVLSADPPMLIIKQYKKSSKTVFIEAISATGGIFLNINREVRRSELPHIVKPLVFDYMYDLAAEAINSIGRCLGEIYPVWREFVYSYGDVTIPYENLQYYMQKLEGMKLCAKLSRKFRERREKALRKAKVVLSITDAVKSWANDIIERQPVTSKELYDMSAMLQPKYIGWYNALYTRELGDLVVIEAVEGPLRISVNVSAHKNEPEECVLRKVKNALLDVALEMAAKAVEWRRGAVLIGRVAYSYLIPLLQDVAEETKQATSKCFG